MRGSSQVTSAGIGRILNVESSGTGTIDGLCTNMRRVAPMVR
mgnify:CR=1 FL=1